MSPVSEERDERRLLGGIVAERYRLVELLEVSSTGCLFLAEHVAMKNKLLLKYLQGGSRHLPEVEARFEREAMATAKIEHPNVARATDYGRTDQGAAYLALEHVEGTSLREAIGQGPMALQRVVHIAHQIASALVSVHACGIVHRNLKPENVLVVQRHGHPDFVKLLDFGIAKIPALDSEPMAGASGAPATRIGTVLGTPGYMAPEQALGQQVSDRTDLYALGVVIYELVTSKRPFPSTSDIELLSKQLTTKPPALSSHPGVGPVPEALERLVLGLLAAEPSARVGAASEVADALTQLSVEVGQPSRASRPPSAQGSIGQASAPPASAALPPPSAAPAPPSAAPAPPSAAPAPRSAAPAPRSAVPAPRSAALSPPSAAPIADAASATVPAPPGPDLPLPSFAGVPTRVKFEGRTVLAKLEALPEVQAAAGDLPPAPRPPPTPPPPPLSQWLSRVVALCRRGAEQSASAARRAHAAACRKVDALRDRLPGRWRARLRPISTPVIVAAGFGLCLLVAVVGLGLALRPARSVPAAAPAPLPETAPVELLASARTPSDLEPLAAKYPRDARVPLKRALLLTEAKQAAAAIDALRAALALEPSITSDEGVEKVVWQALQGDDAAAQAALAVAREHLGERGPDLIYDLAVSETVTPPVRDRANQWLEDTALTARGSPAFAIALDLRNAKNCRERYNLLARAEQHGDVRALTYLRPLRLRVGCGRRGRDDCYECLHKDDRLDDAIAAIEARTTTSTKAAASSK